MTAKKLASGYKVGLVQFNSSFPGENYLPLAIGMLQAYAQQHLEQPEKLVYPVLVY